MNRLKRTVSLVLVVLLMAQLMPVAANARMPLRKSELNEPPATVVPEATVPETEPAVTEAMEEPEETVPETEPEQESGLYTPVPQYFQNGYTEELYGTGTVATHGSSITSLAMVATYLTGHAYAPDELADYFGGYTGSYVEKLEYAADELQLPWKRANYHEALRALEEGKVVIVLTGADSIFNYAQHYVVWAGMTADGKVIVNDPDENNYSHWRLVSGFEGGFTQQEVCAGFGGAWIFDKSEMPADPFIYVEEEKPQVECRYPDISFTKEDLRLFAEIVWLEARGESQEGQQAVAEVILNRMAADNFPDTLYWVIHAEGQFPSTEKLDEAKPTQTQYEAIEAALYGPYILPKDVVFYATYKMNDNVWGQIGGHWFCYQWNWTAEE